MSDQHSKLRHSWSAISIFIVPCITRNGQHVNIIGRWNKLFICSLALPAAISRRPCAKCRCLFRYHFDSRGPVKSHIWERIRFNIVTISMSNGRIAALFGFAPLSIKVILFNFDFYSVLISFVKMQLNDMGECLFYLFGFCLFVLFEMGKKTFKWFLNILK